MAEREAIEKLIASRRAYKAWVTRNGAKVHRVAYTEGEDPSILEKYLEVYKASFEKYQQVNEEISLAHGSDDADLDKEFDQLEEDLFKTEIQIQGYRR